MIYEYSWYLRIGSKLLYISIVHCYSTTHHLEIEYMLLIYAYYFSIYIYIYIFINVRIYIIRCLSILVNHRIIYTSICICIYYTFVLSSSYASQERQPEEQDPRERGAQLLGWGKIQNKKSGVSTTLAFEFIWVNYNDLTVLPHWNHG